jgi:hypothetical protein
MRTDRLHHVFCRMTIICSLHISNVQPRRSIVWSPEPLARSQSAANRLLQAATTRTYATMPLQLHANQPAYAATSSCCTSRGRPSQHAVSRPHWPLAAVVGLSTMQRCLCVGSGAASLAGAASTSRPRALHHVPFSSSTALRRSSCQQRRCGTAMSPVHPSLHTQHTCNTNHVPHVQQADPAAGGAAAAAALQCEEGWWRRRCCQQQRQLRHISGPG